MTSFLSALRPVAFLALVAVFVAGCQEAPLTALDDAPLVAEIGATANAATVTKFPVFVFASLCNGENVLMSGTWQFTTHVRVDGSGGFHLTDNWNIHADGTGDQGNRYRVNYSDNFSFNLGPGATFSNPVAIRVIGQGQAPNLLITAIMHFTVNANGDVTSTVSNTKLTCK